MRRRSLALAWLVASAACHHAHASSPPVAAHPVAVHKPPPPVHVTPPRTILAAYLDATFAGRHKQAWALLSARDHAALSRDDYVKQWMSADQVGDRFDRVQETRYHIGELAVDDERATAIVQVSTVLGSHPMRFVLRLEKNHWRVVYRESWHSP